MESSAKTGFNAQKMFIDAAHVLVEENARLEQRFKNISDNNNDKIKKEKIVRLQIWDTCGQEVYRSLINGFYRNSSLAILVYSITSLKSFKNLEIWLNDIKVNSNPDIKIFLIGNKKDLEEKREVPIDSAKNFFKEHGLYAFMESSAKTGFNAQKMFIDAAHVLVEENARLEQRFKNISDNNNDKLKKEKIKLTQEDEIYSDTDDEQKNKKRRKCC
jgi:small GTP-binding protein